MNLVLNENAYKYYLGYQEKFLDITSHLKQLSNIKINHFGYLRVYYNNGKYFYTSNCPKVTREYFMTIEDSNIFFDRLIPNTTQKNQYHFILWPKTPSNSSMEVYLSNNYWHGFTIANTTHPEYIELWWFATDSETDRIDEYYLSKKDSLLNLAQQFHNKLKLIVNFDNKTLASYPKGFTFNTTFEQNKVQIDDCQSSIFNSLCAKGLILDTKEGSVKLSKRRVEVLGCHSLGMSVKQIANNLKICDRTAEKHLQAIQEITGYNLRSDLTKLYNDQIKNLIIL